MPSSRHHRRILIGGAPAISVLGNGVLIANGDASPSLTDYTDFGDIGLSSPFSRTYTIDNSAGTAKLIVTAINLNTGYTLTDPVSLPLEIPKGQTDTITIRFDAAYNANGYAGTVEIESNGGTYTYAVIADVWVLKAEFASGKTADIGTLTYNEVDGSFTASGGKLTYAAQTTPVWGDQSVRSQLVSMLDDVAMVAVGVINQSTRQGALLGWWTATSLAEANLRIGIRTLSTPAINTGVGSVEIANSLTFAANTDYPVATIARDTDSDANAEEYQAFVKADGYWQRLWTLLGQNDASMYAGFSNLSAVGSLDNFKVKPLASSLFNPSVELLGAVSAGQAWTSPDGDTIKKWTQTTLPGVGQQTNIWIRKQDANNAWILSTASNGLTTLFERVAGANNSRGSGGSSVNGSEHTAIANGANIRFFVGTSQAINYTSAYNFLRATNSEVNALGGGAVSDMRDWKRQIRSENGLGAELVVNGNFATDTIWVKGAGWTISGGTANQSGAGANSLIEQNIGMVLGRYYELTFTVSNYSAGTLTPFIGSSFLYPSVNANGTYTLRGTPAGNGVLYFRADAAFVGSFDNVSVKEIQWSTDSLATQIEAVLNG